ncbi:hypothetical protein SAMN05421810_106129 [Amycolatopsis arida]|uniref:Uncharacterized protein n=1 Tax=Amycolatopsis arida TaxID=587909 RepID=A0A1I5XKG6_9PSEU|nr:WXG100 family type VII secretion target [Amycolatopsis arida]TDX97389.1 hypothetical protein CLV69_102492 [Amycolatopsis arida]SFQ32455.1 hypothetical protein SAMN05421810_106129 [Amycolatopsis arida]
MTLNIHVEADPDSLRATATAMRAAGQSVEEVADSVLAASRRAYDGWTGDGSSGFHGAMGDLRPGADGLADGWIGTAAALELHAADIDTVRARMRQAVEIATAAGLPCTDTTIHDPGPPPPRPEPLPADATKSQFEGYGFAQDRWLAWVERAKAYAECSAVVIEARQIENDSQTLLLKYLGNVADKWHINSSDFLTGLAAGYLAQQGTWRSSAATLGAIADDALKAVRDATLDSGTRAQHAVAGMIAQARAKVDLDKAEANRVGKWLEKLPKPAQRVVTMNLKEFIPKNAQYLSKSFAVLKKVPVSGAAFTAGSVYLDVQGGKDPTTSVVSNTSGLLAGAWSGAAIGSAFGGPVGAVGGFVVATGVGFLVEEFGPDVTDWYHDRMREETFFDDFGNTPGQGLAPPK